MYRKLTAIDIALTSCFTALYVALSFLPMFQIIGFFGKTITAATIIAPIMGIILGPYLGATSAFLGGIIGLFVNPSFSQPSLVAGTITALCAGLLYINKRSVSAFIYLAFLFLFGLYPSVGPIWLYPLLMWFQIAGFLILISPFQSFALKSFKSSNNPKLLYAFFITSLTSTLAGQIAGSLIFELMIADQNFLKTYWQTLTFLYPAERVIIALIAAFIGGPLLKVLRSTNFTLLVSRTKMKKL